MNDLPKTSNDDDVEQILSRLGNRPKPDAAMSQAVRANVMDAWQEQVRLSRRTRYLRVAAAVGALAFAGLLAVGSLEPPVAVVASIDGAAEMQHSIDGKQWQPVDSADVSVGDYLRTGPDAAASMTFASNMNVRLDHTTVIQVDSPNSVNLKMGQLYLDSYDEPSAQGFKVETPHGIAADIGTQFMVQTTESDWSVQVREGLVNVETAEHVISVTPGERVTLTAENDVTRLTVLPTDDSWRWVESVHPPYAIAGKSVDDYLQWVARETGRTVYYDNESQHQTAQRTRLSGSQSIDGLSASESLPHILQTTRLQLLELSDSMITIGALSDD